MARARDDYNINFRNISFRTNLCILVVLYVEMRKQLIQNTSNQKYNFSTSALIFQHYQCPNGSRM
jgi:hypothetical protein